MPCLLFTRRGTHERVFEREMVPLSIRHAAQVGKRFFTTVDDYHYCHYFRRHYAPPSLKVNFSLSERFEKRITHTPRSHRAACRCRYAKITEWFCRRLTTTTLGEGERRTSTDDHHPIHLPFVLAPAEGALSRHAERALLLPPCFSLEVCCHYYCFRRLSSPSSLFNRYFPAAKAASSSETRDREKGNARRHTLPRE